ncbi:hypothetical protein COCMIDRAFT_41874 [Bipolaris oryzae ATCC 44560]|uniref:BTB domain-containing protein n=1 Tax=Bipolaris oryzae ATCC 44560 TaxID=930090 RepID=W6YVT8_COCMI|nr:uncharacterized protein COCMIDRAFT_41874 [Bipolaris oryzae ATCC 44560]EUC39634.1 hypothetical protein COCMIDRAFT_41874 [Bipolaris oryzae ATCC 44560]
MSLVTHEVDPFADTIIILKNPCKNFASWDETLISSQIEFPEPEEEQPIHAQTLEDDRTGKKLSKKEKKARMRGRASRNSTVSNVLEGNGEHAELSSEALSEDQRLVHDRELATRVVGGVENPSVELAELASGPTQSEDDEIHYLVSSRHLMLASPWFRRTLTREEFVESLKNPSDGRYHIYANDWDEEALLILLNIFYIQTRQVPATISLEMLAKIAVLIDYYELENAEVIERDTKDWITNVRRNAAILSSYCRDLMLWICISRVFCMCEEFKKATAVAIKETSIDRIRCNAIKHVISKLHRLLRGCLLPRLENPFMGISLNEICDRSGIAKNTKWWVKSDCYDYYKRYDHEKCEVHSCNLNAKINEVVQDAMAKVRGLKLQDFRDNSQVSFKN